MTVLAINPALGGPIQHTNMCESDREWVLVRHPDTGGSNGDGTVPNTLEVADDYFENGEIPVANVSELTVRVYATIGSLTDIVVKPFFSIVRGSILTGAGNFPQQIMEEAIVSSTIYYDPITIRYRFPTTQNYLFKIPIPPVNFVRFTTESTGTITSSRLRIEIVRGTGFGQWRFQPALGW